MRDRVGRPGPAHAEVPPAARRALGLQPRRAGAAHRAAAARAAGAGRAADPHRPAARRSPTASEVEEVLRRMAEPRRRPLVRELERRPRPAGPPVGAPARCRSSAEPPRRPPSRPRSTARRAGRGSRRPRRAGAGDVRRGGGDVRRPPGRRADRQALRPLAARPGRALRRRRPGGRRRLRTRPRRGVPRRGRRGRHRRRPVAGRWSRRRAAGSRTAPTPSATCTGLLRPPTAPAGARCSAWYALVHLAGSELAPAVASLARVLVPGGWLALALHAGADGAPRRRAGATGPSTSTSSCTTRTRWSPRSEAAGLVDVEWYLRGPLAGEVETRAALRAGAAPGLTPQSRRCISSARSTSRKPRRSLTAFIGGVDAGDDGEDVPAVRGSARGPPAG